MVPDSGVVWLWNCYRLGDVGHGQKVGGLSALQHDAVDDTQGPEGLLLSAARNRYTTPAERKRQLQCCSQAIGS